MAYSFSYHTALWWRTCLANFGCLIALAESARTVLGVNTESNLRTSRTPARLYSGSIYVAVGVIAIGTLKNQKENFAGRSKSSFASLSQIITKLNRWGGLFEGVAELEGNITVSGHWELDRLLLPEDRALPHLGSVVLHDFPLSADILRSELIALYSMIVIQMRLPAFKHDRHWPVCFAYLLGSPECIG